MDLINKQRAIDKFEPWLKVKGYSEGELNVLKAVLYELRVMPPAQPTAKWLIRKWGDDAKCSNCGRSFKDVYDMDNHDQYCRHCGAYMKGVTTTRYHSSSACSPESFSALSSLVLSQWERTITNHGNDYRRTNRTEQNKHLSQRRAGAVHTGRLPHRKGNRRQQRLYHGGIEK